MDMIEKVARALCEADGMLPDILATTVPHAKVWTLFIPAARAAIEAMREPTLEMIIAGAEGSGEDSEAVATGAWRGMIEAALSPAPAPEQKE